MRIVLLGDMTGTRNGQEWPPRGSSVDLPDEEALALIRGKMARPAAAESDVEHAVSPTTEIEERPGRVRR